MHELHEAHRVSWLSAIFFLAALRMEIGDEASRCVAFEEELESGPQSRVDGRSHSTVPSMLETAIVSKTGTKPPRRRCSHVLAVSAPSDLDA